MNSILQIEGLSKKFGKIEAVKNLNLSINQGEVFGILGPNGSGKTTTLGMVLGVVHQSAGTYKWFGQEPSNDIRKKIGSVLETPNFYPYLSARNNLKLAARIKGVDFSTIDEVLTTVGLFERAESPFRTFSYGMKQRLAIGAALLGNPQALILDEPTNGLDPQGIAEIRQLVTKIASRGITIILASHLLDEVQKICSHVAIIRKGQLLFSGAVDSILGTTDSLEIGAENMVALQQHLLNYQDVKEVKQENGLLIVNFSQKPNPADLNQWLTNQGIYISHLAYRQRSLESQFLELLKNPSKS
ncbi:MAG: ATP-binding cassette domain-containing protein [Sphingobacteriia bacterium]|nr:ATP-binding cassette domain-containing protein [Sphingobacteriia bacterium]